MKSDRKWIWSTNPTPGHISGHISPLSMGFFSQEYWSGLPLPPPRDLPDAGIEPPSPVSPALLVDSLPLSHWGSPNNKEKNEIMSFAAKWSKSDRKINIMWCHLYVESKKWYKWTYLQNRNRLTGIENKWLPKEERKGRDKLGAWC